jgi:hypothetical protein
MSEKSGKTLECPLRFAIQTELEYRIHGEEPWQKGMTEIISRAEILFRATGKLKIGTLIDIQYVLPVISRGGVASRVSCQGEVLRMSEGSITAKVARCRLTRG